MDADAALGAAGWRFGTGATDFAEAWAHAVWTDAVRTAEWPGSSRGPAAGAGPATRRSTE